MAAQSTGAVRRAATMSDACLIGPQPSWEDFRLLARQYRDAASDSEKGSNGCLSANRSLAIAKDRETAITQARAAGEAKAGMYSSFNMQESTTVDLGLGSSRDPADWAIAGSPQDCAETILRQHEEFGLDYNGFACLNMPKGLEARLEYLQLISEELLPRLH
jgi:alkanesulfonate monooxygenase SsuD/methylene tetrahydromethanopterin reductase-like flavin-dependent oxidoreductase (luciferase family)